MKIGTIVSIQDPRNADAAFQPVREMGLESCQLKYKPDVFRPEDAKLIRDAADRNGIEISAYFLGPKDTYTVYRDLRDACLTNGIGSPIFRVQRFEYFMRGCEFVSWLGITDMIIHAGFIQNNPYDPDYQAMRVCVEHLGKKLGSMGLNLLFETGQESPVTLLRLIEEAGTGNLYVNLDTGNCLMYGYSNPVDALYTLGRLVRNVHVKDGVPPTDPYHLGSETPLGEGEVDFDRFFTRLLSLGYDRYLTIEREISGPQQREDILKAKNYIEGFLKKHGKA